MRVAPLTCTEPVRLIAQAVLPGIDAVAVPAQVIEVPDSVAVAVPLPETLSDPLQVAANVPVTLVAVAPVTVHVKPPQVFVWVDTALVDENVPALNPAAVREAVALVVGDVDAAGIDPHPAANANPTTTASCRMFFMPATITRRTHLPPRTRL